MFLRRFFYVVDSRTERLKTALAMDELPPLSASNLTELLPVGTLLTELLSINGSELTKKAQELTDYHAVVKAIEQGAFPMEQPDEVYSYYKQEKRQDAFFASLLAISPAFKLYSYSSDEFLIYELLHFEQLQSKYRQILSLLDRAEVVTPQVFYDYLADERIIPHNQRLLVPTIDLRLRLSAMACPTPYYVGRMGEDLDKAYQRFLCVSESEREQEFGLRQRYYVTNFDELFSLGLAQSIKLGMRLKPCANCGKYFVPKKRSDTLYCDRTSPQNADFTCRDYMLKRLWYDESRRDEVEKLSKSVYQTYFMRSKRHPEDEEFQARFKAFSEQRSRWRKDVKAGKVSGEDFKAWLVKMREEM